MYLLSRTFALCLLFITILSSGVLGNTFGEEERSLSPSAPARLPYHLIHVEKRFTNSSSTDISSSSTASSSSSKTTHGVPTTMSTTTTTSKETPNSNSRIPSWAQKHEEAEAKHHSPSLNLSLPEQIGVWVGVGIFCLLSVASLIYLPKWRRAARLRRYGAKPSSVLNL